MVGHQNCQLADARLRAGALGMNEHQQRGLGRCARHLAARRPIGGRSSGLAGGAHIRGYADRGSNDDSQPTQADDHDRERFSTRLAEAAAPSGPWSDAERVRRKILRLRKGLKYSEITVFRFTFKPKLSVYQQFPYQNTGDLVPNARLVVSVCVLRVKKGLRAIEPCQLN